MPAVHIYPRKARILEFMYWMQFQTNFCTPKKLEFENLSITCHGTGTYVAQKKTEFYNLCMRCNGRRTYLPSRKLKF